MGQQAHLWDPHVVGWQPPASRDEPLDAPELPEEGAGAPDDEPPTVTLEPGASPELAASSAEPPDPLGSAPASFAFAELAPPEPLAATPAASVSGYGKLVEGVALQAAPNAAPIMSQSARSTTTATSGGPS